MISEIAQLHVRCLPNTGSSKRGVAYVAWLYKIVAKIGYLEVVKRNHKVVGVMSGVGPIILTLAVEPAWQHQGIGRELIKRRAELQIVYTQGDAVGFYEKMGFAKLLKIGKIQVLWRK